MPLLRFIVCLVAVAVAVAGGCIPGFATPATDHPGATLQAGDLFAPPAGTTTIGTQSNVVIAFTGPLASARPDNAPAWSPASSWLPAAADPSILAMASSSSGVVVITLPPCPAFSITPPPTF